MAIVSNQHRHGRAGRSKHIWLRLFPAAGNLAAFSASSLLHLFLLAALALWVLPADTETTDRELEVVTVETTTLEQLPEQQSIRLQAPGGSGQTGRAIAPSPTSPKVQPVSVEVQSAMRYGTGNGPVGDALGRFGQAQSDLLQPRAAKKGEGATFFGLRAAGKRFVFVVDSSGSMMIGQRWQAACHELLSSVQALGEKREFYVIFFDGQAHPMFEPRAATTTIPANEANIRMLGAWMNNIQLGMATKPLGAVRKALALDPDAIFLLSDGEFQDATALFLRRHTVNVRKKGKTPIMIHTIGLNSVKGQRVLKRIARENDGEYRLVAGPWARREGIQKTSDARVVKKP